MVYKAARNKIQNILDRYERKLTEKYTTFVDAQIQES